MDFDASAPADLVQNSAWIGFSATSAFLYASD
jgi:hypothetical protein